MNDTVGIVSVGWHIPEGRRTAAEIASHYRLPLAALEAMQLQAHVAPGPGDHPSSMGAKAVASALDAAGRDRESLDLLIFAGMTRDHPAPWVGAFGVLHELGCTRAAGFDVSARCAAVHDALWIAAQFVRAGTARVAAVVCADRFDYLLAPPRPTVQPQDAAYSAGAAAALVTADAPNCIAAFSSLTNPDLSLHAEQIPLAGGSRAPFSGAQLETGHQWWCNRMKVAQATALRAYLKRADHHNITAVCRAAGFEQPDFLACAPLDVRAQLESLAAVGVGAERLFLTFPAFGHMGPADSLAAIGLAIAAGRDLGRNMVMSTRSALYSNALAITARDRGLKIRAAGNPIGDASWRAMGVQPGGLA